MKTKVTIPKDSKVTIELTIEEAQEFAKAIAYIESPLLTQIYEDITKGVGK